MRSTAIFLSALAACGTIGTTAGEARIPTAPVTPPQRVTADECVDLYTKSRERKDPSIFRQGPEECFELITEVVTYGLHKSERVLRDNFPIAMANFYGNWSVEGTEIAIRNMNNILGYTFNSLDGNSASKPELAPLPPLEQRCLEYVNNYRKAITQLHTSLQAELTFVEQTVPRLGVAYLAAKSELLKTVSQLEVESTLYLCSRE